MIYGVSTELPGQGMRITDKFDSLAEANSFADLFRPFSGVVCTFSDGRWRPLTWNSAEPAESRPEREWQVDEDLARIVESQLVRVAA